MCEDDLLAVGGKRRRALTTGRGLRVRDELRSDPGAALSSRGGELSDAQQEELRELDTSGSDEELAERVSKRLMSDVRLKRRIRAI